MCALEAERDPTEHFMNFGKILLQAFRTQLMMASDPGIPLFNILVRLCTAVHEADTFAKATQPLAERRGTQISLRCQLCHIYGHVTFKSNARDATEGSYSQHGRPLNNGEGLLAASHKSGRRQPHPFRHLPSNSPRQRTAPPAHHPIFQIARRNHREGQWSLSRNDARLWYDETPTYPLWASYMRRANEVAREMWAPSTW
ncbi:hypothetical protein TCDM_11549 [Trypanosoma cruzi Dm28c]|uniref:Uncharacterized protein n=1 Tax=Trypanosoma cruzi Dm28c TaxID=1416333 RepID=V5D0B4_TRYCR|nr:hypothetical protein TCDM_11549 [Trypanosoma cruzi Dm28c]